MYCIKRLILSPHSYIIYPLKDGSFKETGMVIFKGVDYLKGGCDGRSVSLISGASSAPT